MASLSVPLFPNDVPTASVSVVDYKLLRAGDEKEIEKLWVAATEGGFWYVKNHDSQQEVKDMFTMGSEMVNISPEEKLRHAQEYGQVFGYKYADPTHIRSDNGAPDLVEYVSIAKDDAFKWPEVVHRRYPSVINEHLKSTVEPFSQKMFDVCRSLLQALNDRLGLPKETFANLHSETETSPTEARCIRAQKNPVLDADAATVGAHTDYSSLTILHHLSGGLQIMPPGTNTWLYIKPVPGYGICNLGNAMSIYSGGILKAGLHRVVAPPKEQNEYDRWALVFFIRPGNSQIVTPLTDLSADISYAVSQAPEGKFSDARPTAEEWFAGSIRGRQIVGLKKEK
jgi:isopenicillin N synthase-like dioxygenase